MDGHVKLVLSCFFLDVEQKITGVKPVEDSEPDSSDCDDGLHRIFEYFTNFVHFNYVNLLNW